MASQGMDFFSYSYISVIKLVKILFVSSKNVQDHRSSQPQSDMDTGTKLHTASKQENSNQTVSHFPLGKGNIVGGQRSPNDPLGGLRPFPRYMHSPIH